MISGWPLDRGDLVQSILPKNRNAATDFTKVINRHKKEPVQMRPLPEETKEKELDLLVTPLGQHPVVQAA